MRCAFVILLLFASCSMILAQSTNVTASRTGEFPYNPPAYNLLRFNENYYPLANPTNRMDFFDPAKYIPLRSDDPTWYLSFGGEMRHRFEGAWNPDFSTANAHDVFWLQRLALLADLHLGDGVRIFAEGISGEVAGETFPPPPTQRDAADLMFAFVDVVPYLTRDEELTLRAGRFGMSLGAGRLVATRAAPNIPFRFDGLEATYVRPEWQVTSFLTRPAKDSGGIDGWNDKVDFWGMYATHWFDTPHKLGLDLYYLGIHRDENTYASGTANETRHSLGLRQFGVLNKWDWNTEEVLQVGSFGRDSILAWTASVDTGYTFDTTFQPRFGIKVDVTSGDGDPNDGRQETFDALFFKSGYFNDASQIRPANLIDVHPNWTLQLTKKLSANGGVDAFWRYSRHDAIYAPPGNIVLPALANAPGYVTTAFDINFDWQIQRHISFQASYVHFLTDSYVRQSGGGGGMDYVSTTLSLLF